MAAEIHYFGIRHHGPGSARQLVDALEHLRPELILIEGPSDQSDLIPMMGSRQMVPPVALLSYPKDSPEEASFWPFAVYSPEYQAVFWAVANTIPARFIDIPSSWRPLESEEEIDAEEDGESEGSPDEPEVPTYLRQDPIGRLAAAAGYSDGESWWREVIEENPNPGPVFHAVADAMTALREDEGKLETREAAREAHMRLEIHKAQKEVEGPVAVVCGAYHVPALQAKHPLKGDRAAIKGGPKKKMMATWAPWTSPRLAFSSGYGAGVAAPGWCLHLWETPREKLISVWLVKIAGALRNAGQIVSSASVIEAERLSVALTAIRGKSVPGFEELREAAVACLCFGETLLWQTVEDQLLIGNEVGEIPNDVPLAPLLEDLKRQQRSARIKPEALPRELSLDLRSESGLFRSTLLHRLSQLGVPWGLLSDPGKSRGTFRERWTLEWKPEYAVELVENLVFGPTIEYAAAGKLSAVLKETQSLPELADLVLSALTAQLPETAEAGIQILEKRASQSSDCLSLLKTLPPLATILRYGEARSTDVGQMSGLFEQIAIRGAIGMHYATHNLDSDAASEYRGAVLSADEAIRLISDGDESEMLAGWIHGLRDQLDDAQASRLVVGTAARLLYESEDIDAEGAASLIERQLSPGTPVGDAAAFFEGFFDGGGARLIYDKSLRDAVDKWLVSLEEETFTEHLPLLRRVFSSLDSSERSRLLDSLFGRKSGGLPMLKIAGEADERWNVHAIRLAEIFEATPIKPEDVVFPE